MAIRKKVVTRVELVFGAMARPFAKQLADQRLEATGITPELADRLSKASTLLGIHGALTDREARAVHKRIFSALKVRSLTEGK